MKTSRGKQHAAALITALFVVLVASTLASAILQQTSLDLRRVHNNYFSSQTFHYALGVEYWAMGRLDQDALNDQTRGAVDALDEVWNEPLTSLQVNRQAQISGQITDLQGLFNLNSLAPATAEPTPQSIAQSEMFARLLNKLEIDPGLANAVADWIDTDRTTRSPGGAEDTEYLRLKVPYRTPNMLMATLDEIGAVQGITPEIIKKLRPWVKVLPATTTINVNTAPKEILLALSPLIDEPTAESIINARKLKPFLSVEAFINYVKSLRGKGGDRDDPDDRDDRDDRSGPSDPTSELQKLQLIVGTSSQYFQCKALVIMQEAHFIQSSLLHREAQKIRVLQRIRGEF